MQRHDWFSANPKEPMSHLSLSPCTGSRVQLASSSRHWCLHIEQPQAQHPPTSTHLWKSTSPQEVWDLRLSDASWCHHREAQNHSPERFHSLFLTGGMNFPPLSECWIPDNFQAILETHLFRHHLNSSTLLPFLNFALFPKLSPSG